MVREDAHLLYGFATADERTAFRQLLKISGVGARSWRSRCSPACRSPTWRRRSPRRTAARLTKVPGIGKKTAERLLLELQGQARRCRCRAPAHVPAGGDAADVLNALLALGYKPRRKAQCGDPGACAPGLARGRRASGQALKVLWQNPDVAVETDRLISAQPASAAGGGDRARAAPAHARRVRRPGTRSASSSRSSSRRRARRGEALDHVLLFGPPGLGKTTLAHIIAREMGVNLRQTSGPVLERPGDLAALLTNLEPRDVLFIDEIHRLSPVVEEILYPALEDFQIDIMIGEGPAARSIKLDLPPFTLVGATTRAGMLTNPLRDRFGIVARLEFYSPDELARIVQRSARLLDVAIDEEGAREIARRSRGTPRIANRLLRRVRDYAEVKAEGAVTRDVADAALAMLDVDALGLDVMDRKLLLAVIEKFGGGPVGVENLAAAIGEERDTIEDVLEPYLIQQGYLQRTPRGRVATLAAYRHFGVVAPAEMRDLLSDADKA